MASPEPPNDPPPGSGGNGGSHPSKDSASGSAAGQHQQLIDLFGLDAAPATMILVLILLEMIRQSFDLSCIC